LYTTSLASLNGDSDRRGSIWHQIQRQKYQYVHPLTIKHLPSVIADIQCPTPQHLQAELDSLTAVLALGEKEETWDKMEKALIRFAGVTRGGGYKHLPLFTDGIGRKGCASKVAECVCPADLLLVFQR
jgi:hypothetical protein